MANPEQLATLMEGPEAWNAWRRGNQGVWPDLSGATLTGLDLSAYHLDDANLWRADLQGVTLHGTKLYRVFAEQSNWTGAHLQNSTFVILKADRSTFDETKMFGAIFHLCSFRESSFREANLRYTIFAAVDLHGARGLTQAYLDHATIGVDTFFKSGGLPDEFLHAAHIPDEFITYAHSLVGKPIEFYSCFISYSGKDAEFTTRLHADLQIRKIKTWYAPKDLKIGDRFHTRIDESVRIHDKIVLVLSRDSLDSAWVRREVEAAREREDREKRDILFPIRLDDTVFEVNEAWAVEIRRAKHIGDFRNWKSHDGYRTALERLLRDLTKEGPIMMR